MIYTLSYFTHSMFPFFVESPSCTSETAHRFPCLLSSLHRLLLVLQHHIPNRNRPQHCHCQLTHPGPAHPHGVMQPPPLPAVLSSVVGVAAAAAAVRSCSAPPFCFVDEVCLCPSIERLAADVHGRRVSVSQRAVRLRRSVVAGESPSLASHAPSLVLGASRRSLLVLAVC